MKTRISLGCIIWVTLFSYSQSIVGTWKTVDDESGEAKSIVKIYEKEGKIYGDIVELINPRRKNPTCDKCSGGYKGQPIVGMTIIKGLSKTEDVYRGGTILNPKNGKLYDCRLQLQDNPNMLQVRGYLAFFYKTQYWLRVKS